MAWDSTALYVAARLEEPHLWATLTRRDTIIYLDNDFELFLDPDGDTHHYYELEINALGTVWDLLLERPYRDGDPAVTAWDIAGLRSAVRVRGTLNDPSDRDSGWTVELAIPWEAVGVRDPAPGRRLRVNFSRVQWTLDVVDGAYRKRADPGTGRALPERNWVWSPQYAVNMHMPEMWGVAVLGDARGAAPTPAEASGDEARWRLRRVYYAQRAWRARTGQFARDVSALGVRDVTLHADSSGYVAETDGAGGRWRIDQSGRIVRVEGGR